MRGLLILIPAALLLGGIFLALFVAAAKRGQFDDLETPAMRALHEDEPDPSKEENDARS